MEFAKINVRVRDVRVAVDYVQKTLGGEVLNPVHSAPFGEVAIVRISGLTIEIIQPPPGSVMAAAIERRGEGIDSIGFSSENISDSVAMLADRGAQLVRPTGEGLTETTWVHPKNPLSISIELFRRDSGSSPHHE